MVPWTVRGGAYGEYEQLMLDQGVVLLGTGQWDTFGDVRRFRTRGELEVRQVWVLATSPVEAEGAS